MPDANSNHIMGRGNRSLSWLVGMICIAVMAALALQATILPPA
jgi:hypothetical protein